jgi:uncharacterized small protein (DUF1192 family)
MKILDERIADYEGEIASLADEIERLPADPDVKWRWCRIDYLRNEIADLKQQLIEWGGAV